MPITTKTAMIDPLEEEMMTLAKAGRKAPGGPFSPQTVTRWCNEGFCGIKLEHLLIGGRMHTSLEAMTRFFVATTEAKQAAKRDDDTAERSADVQAKLEQAGLA